MDTSIPSADIDMSSLKSASLSQQVFTKFTSILSHFLLYISEIENRIENLLQLRSRLMGRNNDLESRVQNRNVNPI